MIQNDNREKAIIQNKQMETQDLENQWNNGLHLSHIQAERIKS